MIVNESCLHVRIWMNLTKLTLSQRAYIVWLHLHKIQKQVQLIVVLEMK